MTVLNLYAGIGGNRKLWEDVEATAVENNEQIAGVYKSLFQSDKVIVYDAHQFLLDHANEFDFVWSSPPCQSHSRMVKATRHDIRKYPDMVLYQEIIWLKHFHKGLWVVENVKPYYEPLIPPTAIIGRHYFWSNFKILPFKSENIKGFIDSTDSPEGLRSMKEWLGLSFDGNIYYDGNHSPEQVLRNAVHPEIGKHVMDCALNKVKSYTKQKTLFNE